VGNGHGKQRAFVALAWLLCAATLALGVRAATTDPVAATAKDGIFEGPALERARTLAGRLATALLAMQQEDGSFSAPGDAPRTDVERVAASAVATAVLARAERLQVAPDAEFLKAGVRLGTKFLQGEIAQDGAVGRAPDTLETHVDRVIATAASLMAFVTVQDKLSLDAARTTAPGLAALVGDGVRGGWTRSLVAICVDVVWRENRQALLPAIGGRPSRLVKGRDVGTRRDLGDLRVAEAIVRQVLMADQADDALGAAVIDSFPGEILALALESPPIWEGENTDMPSWWMRAWLVARAPEGGAWFTAMVDALEAEGLEEDGHIAGGFYSDALMQTACALGALLEGFDV
jgi:hypothetical protein